MRLVFRATPQYPELKGIFADGFVDELRTAAAKPDVTELVVDLEGAARVGSRALSGMYAVYQDMKERGKTLRVVNMTAGTANMIRMLNMGELLAGPDMEEPDGKVGA